MGSRGDEDPGSARLDQCADLVVQVRHHSCGAANCEEVVHSSHVAEGAAYETSAVQTRDVDGRACHLSFLARLDSPRIESIRHHATDCFSMPLPLQPPYVTEAPPILPEAADCVVDTQRLATFR
jgi:hypothetical protein